LTALEPRLPRLTLALQPGAPPDTSVTVGSLELQGGSFGIPLPIDPGKQVLLVHAAGRASRTYEVVLGEGESKRIEIAPGPPAAASGAENLRERVDSTPSRGGVSLGKTGSAQSHLRRSGTGRTVGFIVGGAGVLAVATGAVTGVMTLNEKKTVDDHCSSALSLCDRTGKEAADRGRSLALVSTIAFITGGVALGIGGYLLLTSSPEMPAQVTAAVAPGSAQIGLETAW
jgi:hypothetical protein